MAERSASTRDQVLELVQAALVWHPRSTITIRQVRSGRWTVQVPVGEAVIGPGEPSGEPVEP